MGRMGDDNARMIRRFRSSSTRRPLHRSLTRRGTRPRRRLHTDDRVSLPPSSVAGLFVVPFLATHLFAWGLFASVYLIAHPGGDSVFTASMWRLTTDVAVNAGLAMEDSLLALTSTGVAVTVALYIPVAAGQLVSPRGGGETQRRLGSLALATSGVFAGITTGAYIASMTHGAHPASMIPELLLQGLMIALSLQLGTHLFDDREELRSRLEDDERRLEMQLSDAALNSLSDDIRGKFGDDFTLPPMRQWAKAARTLTFRRILRLLIWVFGYLLAGAFLGALTFACTSLTLEREWDARTLALGALIGIYAHFASGMITYHDQSTPALRWLVRAMGATIWLLLLTTGLVLLSASPSQGSASLGTAVLGVIHVLWRRRSPGEQGLRLSPFMLSHRINTTLAEEALTSVWSRQLHAGILPRPLLGTTCRTSPLRDAAR